MESRKGTTLISSEVPRDINCLPTPPVTQKRAFSPGRLSWEVGRWGQGEWYMTKPATTTGGTAQTMKPTHSRWGSRFALEFMLQPLSSAACSPQTWASLGCTFWESSLLLLFSAGLHSDPATKDLCPRNMWAFSISSSRS